MASISVADDIGCLNRQLFSNLDARLDYEGGPEKVLLDLDHLSVHITMSSADVYVAPIHRFYIDVRPLIPMTRRDSKSLPLLSMLRAEQQASIQAYKRPADRLMSLGSALLKYFFIHQYAKVPWKDICISKTAKPHGRPYWDPLADWKGKGGIEFNVTHQNGLVALVGCLTSTAQSPDYAAPLTMNSGNQMENAYFQVRLGVDLACTQEEGRTPSDVTTQDKLEEWVDIFKEMFSEASRKDMKSALVSNANSDVNIIQKRFRRFYAHWALKEAFIKMVGEGLLADWLAQLEFENVHAPDPAIKHDHPCDGFSWAFRDQEEFKWTPPGNAVKNISPTLYGKKVDRVQMQLVAYEKDYLFATASKGIVEPEEGRWIKLDIDKDVRPCAEGRCKCLEEKITDMSSVITSPIFSDIPAEERPSYTLVQADELSQGL